MEECRIKFPGPVSKKTVTHLVIDYLKYVLYYRGQFPSPLEQLKVLKDNEILKSTRHPEIDGHFIYSDESDASPPRPAIPATAKDRSRQKFYETISKFDDFFKELTRILETNNVIEIVLNLGPNMMNPKELYRVRMPLVCTNEECTTDYASLQNCKVQFFRNIVNSDTIWADLKSDSLLPISILLLLENGVTLDEHMEQKRFYALPKNCKQRTVHFDKCIHLEDSLQIGKYQHVTLPNGDSSFGTTSGLWVKLKPDLKGFKSC